MTKPPLLLYRGEEFNPNFFYFSGQDFDHSFLLIHRGRRTLLLPRLNERAAKEACGEVKFGGTVIACDNPFKELSGALHGKEVHVDSKALSMDAFLRLRKFCRPVGISEKLYGLRSRKKEAEIAKLGRAVRLTRELIDTVMDSRLQASTEEGLRKLLLKETLERGLEPAFEPIVATGRNSAFPHHVPGRKKLGDIILVDYGVKYRHYCSDITRCYFQDRNGRAKLAYDKLVCAFGEVMERLPGCATGKDIALSAEKAMEKAGMPKMIHSVGHGIGLSVHEFPRISRKYNDRIDGCVFALEPAAYFRDFGVRFEQMVHFSGKKARIL